MLVALKITLGAIRFESNNILALVALKNFHVYFSKWLLGVCRFDNPFFSTCWFEIILDASRFHYNILSLVLFKNFFWRLVRLKVLFCHFSLSKCFALVGLIMDVEAWHFEKWISALVTSKIIFWRCSLWKWFLCLSFWK